MDRLKLKGVYTAQGWTLDKLAKEIGMSSPTLIAKQKNDTLTIKDVSKIKAALNLNDEDVLDIFMRG